MMKTGKNGIDLIKRCEGFSLKPYRDVAGHLTIGYGHRIKPGEILESVTPEQAEALLKDDLATAENGVNRLVKADLSQNQFDALVSFCYNLGVTAFENSTLLRLLNRGDIDTAASQLSRWIYAGGKQQPGLIARRAAETTLFLQKNL